MRYAKIPKLDDLMERLSDDQLVDLAEKTVKEGDELQHTPSLLTLERLVNYMENVRLALMSLSAGAKFT